MNSFIESVSGRIEQLETAFHQAWWNLATLGEEKYAKELEEIKIALRRLFANQKDYQFLKRTRTDDPLLARQRTLLLHSYRENQIPPHLIEKIAKLESRVETIYTQFRSSVGERHLSNNDLKQILQESLDSDELKTAWEASKKIGEEVEPLVKQLVHLRNQSAIEAGFANFYSMRLELQELEEASLFSLLDHLEKLTLSSWVKYKAELDQKLAKRYGVSTLMPWHYQDPFFQYAPTPDYNIDALYHEKDLVNIAKAFFADTGLPVDDILERSDLYERVNKNQHALCLCIDRKQDVRTLCNLRSTAYWMGTLLHELGHGVYFKYINPSLPFLLRTYAHLSSTEAIAMLFGRLVDDPAFLEKYADIKASPPSLNESLIVFCRFALVMVYFERALYQQPEQDLNQLWWDLAQKYQHLTPIEGRNKPDWAAKLHLACHPVYYQNYILGEMTGSHLLHNFKGPNLGPLLKTKFFELGATLPWNETLLKATGEYLNPLYYSQDVDRQA